MKNILIAALLVVSGSSAFASSACIISFDNESNVTAAYEHYGVLSVNCEKGNPNSKVTKKIKGGTLLINNADIATAIAELMGLGYEVVSQSKETWTLVKK